MAVELKQTAQDDPQIALEPSNGPLHSKESYRRIGTLFISIYCLVCPLSIALSQISIGLLVSFSAYAWWSSKGEYFIEAFSSSKLGFLFAPIFAWLAISGASSFFGVDTGKSFIEFFNSSVFLLFPFFVYVILSLYNQKEKIEAISKLLILLGFSQLLASLHSFYETGFGTLLSLKTPGPLTESGQLVLVIPCLLGLVFAKNLNQNKESKLSLLGPTAIFLCLLTFSWPENISAAHSGIVQIISGLLVVAIIASLFRSSKSKTPLQILAVLFAALIVNLKRGPWFGVIASALVLGSFLSKKLILASGLVTLAAFFLLSPVRERTLSVIDHYLIGGGRHEMWTIGMEITERFPLGVGLDNADVIQKFDPDLPDTHRHMHNNFLNIAVELGWLGLIIYIWWMFRFIAVGIKNALKSSKITEHDIYLLAFSTAILGWQVAGFAEFNFGDSEIKLLAFLIMGFIMSLYCNDKIISEH